jgi:hypothetical protein
MPAHRTRYLLAAILCLASAAEVVRLIVYTFPASGIFSVGWALVSAILLAALARIESDRALGWLAGATPVIVLLCTATGLLAASRGRDMPVVIASTIVLALPILVPVLALSRLFPFIARRVGGSSPRAGALISLVVVTVAAYPAWDMVTLSPTGEARFDLMSSHAGCYRVSVGPWRPASQPGHSILRIPAVIQLDTSRGDPDMSDRAGGTIWERGKPLVRPGWLFGGVHWRPIDDDRVVLVWGSGTSGLTVTLRRTSSGYRGRATAWTDIISMEPSPRASVTATATSCSELPPDSVRMPGALKRAMERRGWR